MFLGLNCQAADLNVEISKGTTSVTSTNLIIKLDNLKAGQRAIVKIWGGPDNESNVNFSLGEFKIPYRELGANKTVIKNVPMFFSFGYNFWGEAFLDDTYGLIVKTQKPQYFDNYGIRKTANLHLFTGVSSSDEFWGWFYVQDVTSGENFWTKPTKYQANAQSFGFDLLKDKCNEVYLGAPFPAPEYLKTKVCLRPNTNYMVLAVARVDSAMEKSGQFTYFTTPSWPTPKIATMAPVSITNKSAMLKAQIIDTGDVYVFFKVWEQRNNESALPAPKIDLDNEKIYKTKGQDTITFVAQKTVDGKDLEPGKNYCYNAYSFWPRTKSIQSGQRICFKTKSTFDLAVPHYLQCIGPWSEFLFTTGERFCKDGCLDTSLSMILAYWYPRDLTFKKNWDQQLRIIANNLSGDDLARFNQAKQITGNVPNPYTSYWFARLNGYWWDSDIWAKLKLKPVPVNTNSRQAIEERYLAKGIPLLAYCTPSHASGRSNHFAVLMDFADNSVTGNVYTYNGRNYLTDIITNDSYYGAKRILNAVNDYNHVKEYKNPDIPGVPKCGYQYGIYTENQFFGGLVAIVPIDLELDEAQ